MEFEDLYEAYLDCNKKKSNKKSAKKFEINALQEVCNLRDEVNDRTYKPRSSICFIIKDPSIREIFAAYYRDRILQHYVVRKLENRIERELIYDTYSCRKGKGTDFAINRLHKNIRSLSKNNTIDLYYLKLDIKAFFISIDRANLEKIVLGLNHNDSDVSYLIHFFTNYNCTKGCIKVGSREKWKLLPKYKSLFDKLTGIPIGNITSQVFANLILNEADHICMKYKNIRYHRYVDDIIVISPNIYELREFKKKFTETLVPNGFEVNNKKTHFGKSVYGIKFLGKILYHRSIILSNSSYHRISSKINNSKSKPSYKGICYRYGGYYLYNRDIFQKNSI